MLSLSLCLCFCFLNMEDRLGCFPPLFLFFTMDETLGCSLPLLLFILLSHHLGAGLIYWFLVGKIIAVVGYITFDLLYLLNGLLFWLSIWVGSCSFAALCSYCSRINIKAFVFFTTLYVLTLCFGLFLFCYWGYGATLGFLGTL